MVVWGMVIRFQPGVEREGELAWGAGVNVYVADDAPPEGFAQKAYKLLYTEFKYSADAVRWLRGGQVVGMVRVA